MKNKMKMVFVLVVALSFVGIAQAGTFWSAGSGDWATGSSWDTGTKPGAGDQAIVLWNHTITVTGHEYVGLLDLGYVANGWVTVAAGGFLDAHLGTMHIGQTAEGNLEVGTFNLYGEAYAEQLFVANERANGRGVLNIYDGGLMTVGAWACNIGNSGTEEGAGGQVNLYGGTMIVDTDGGLFMTANGRIDIEAGTLLVKDDGAGQNLYYIEQYINDGLITSHGGTSIRCFLVVSSSGGYISVKTGGCTCETYLPEDLNHDCYVDMFDLAFLAQNWLNCTIPSDSNCVQ